MKYLTLVPKSFGLTDLKITPLEATWQLTQPGVQRKRNETPLILSIQVSTQETATSRSLHATVIPHQTSTSFEFVYICTEETLASGKKLRTYFDVSMLPEIYWVPNDCTVRRRRPEPTGRPAARRRGPAAGAPVALADCRRATPARRRARVRGAPGVRGGESTAYARHHRPRPGCPFHR